MTPTPQKLPSPPGHLSVESREWWQGIIGEFVMDASAVKILTEAASCLDRIKQARAIIRKQGLTFRDRFGSPKRHPATSIELDNNLAFSRLMKTLGLPVGEEVGPIPGTRPHKKKG